MGVGGGREGGFGGEGRRGVGEIKKLEHGSRISINLVLSSPYKFLLNIENLRPNASYASHPIPEPKNIDAYLCHFNSNSFSICHREPRRNLGNNSRRIKIHDIARRIHHCGCVDICRMNQYLVTRKSNSGNKYQELPPAVRA